MHLLSWSHLLCLGKLGKGSDLLRGAGTTSSLVPLDEQSREATVSLTCLQVSSAQCPPAWQRLDERPTLSLLSSPSLHYTTPC